MAQLPIFNSIQYLRAAAALMVVLYHLGLPLSRAGYTGYWPAGLERGVDLFFVISGFIMVMTTQAGNVSPGRFLARRFLRIAPLYYVLTLTMLAVYAVAPSLLQSFRFEFSHVLSSFAFWPHLNPATGEVMPVLIPGWTLNYEMFFYLLFAGAMVAGRWSTPLLVVTFLGLVVLGQVVTGGVAFSFFTAPLILQFLMGVLLGHAFLAARFAAPPMALVALSALAVPLLVFGPWLLPQPWTALETGLLATAIVAAFVWLERAGRVPQWRGLLVLGDASYAIYLIHPPLLSAIGQLWGKLGLPHSLVLIGIACVATSIASGLFLHALVELPLRRYFRRVTAPSRIQRSSIA